MAMRDEQSVVVKLTVEELKTINTVLDSFCLLVKKVPCGKKKRKELDVAYNGIFAIKEKLNDVIKEKVKDEV